MMRIMTKRLVLLTFLLLVSLPASALACACCAEKGFYLSKSIELKDFYGEIIDKLAPGSATLFTDAAYPENVKGLGSESTSFSVGSSFGNGIWALNLMDKTKKTGILNFERPRRAHQLMYDSDPFSEKNMVVLNKQISLTGRVKSASGFLSKGESYDMRYELVLNGKGNVCTEASDFKTFFLKINGLMSDYRFYGKLKMNEGRELQKRGEDNGAAATVSVPKP